MKPALLLLLMGSIAALPKMRVVPGGVLENGGRLYAIKESVEIKVDCSSLRNTPAMLAEVDEGLQLIKDTINKEVVMNRHQRLALLRIVEASEEALQPLRGEKTSRPKRGLINGIGIAASWLFGVATQEDVEEKMRNYAGSIVTTMKIGIEEMHRVAKNLNLLGNTVSQTS